MSLLFQCDRFAVFEPLDDSEAVALDNMQPDKNIYYIQFNHELFQSVCWFERMIMICSINELQIIPPKIPHKKCLFDVISRIPDTPEIDHGYTDTELLVISELPNGWKLSSLKQFQGYRPEPLPEINYEMQRLQWYLGAPRLIDAQHTLFIHPEYDRPLTPLEWSAIDAASGDDPLEAWLGWLSTTPSPSRAALAAMERTEGIRAVVDLRPLTRWPALDVYPYPNKREPSHLFNVNRDGSLRVDWHLISRKVEGTITYANELQTITEDTEGIS